MKSIRAVLRKTRRRNHDDIRAAEWDTEHLGLKLERERVSRVLVIEKPQVSSRNRSQLVGNLPIRNRKKPPSIWIHAHPAVSISSDSIARFRDIPRHSRNRDTHNRNFATRSAVTTFVRDRSSCRVTLRPSSSLWIWANRA